MHIGIWQISTTVVLHVRLLVGLTTHVNRCQARWIGIHKSKLTRLHYMGITIWEFYTYYCRYILLLSYIVSCIHYYCRYILLLSYIVSCIHYAYMLYSLVYLSYNTSYLITWYLVTGVQYTVS
jgi:hypothetical protein